jgi:hypothetical protein
LARSLYRLAAVLLLACALPLGTYAAKGSAPARGPEWAQLTAQQQQILAPLANDWTNIEGARRNKWVEIAKRYPTMTPQQQARLQSQMKQWAGLTPEQRAEVRARYRNLQKLPPEKREEIRRKWHEYDKLTEQEKHKLRQAHPGRSAKQENRSFDLD